MKTTETGHVTGARVTKRVHPAIQEAIVPSRGDGVEVSGGPVPVQAEVAAVQADRPLPAGIKTTVASLVPAPGLAASIQTGTQAIRVRPRPTGIYNALLYPSYEATRMGQKAYFSTLSTGLSLQSSFLAVMGMGGLSLTPGFQVAQSILSAGSEMSDRFSKEYTKPAFNLTETQIAGKTVGITEEIVSDKAFGSLLHFKRDTNRNDPKLLIVAPMSGHYATLLRETVASMLPNHDVYITDWKNARDVPLSEGEFGLDEYVDYVKDFIKTTGPNSHVLAVCQPTVPTLAAVSLLAEEKSSCQPLSMTLMGGPIDTRAAATEVTKLAESKPIDWFEKNLIGKVPEGYAGAGRLVYPGFMQLSSFIAMHPDKHVQSHMEMFRHLMAGHDMDADKLKKFYDEYLAVCDLPARFYLDTVQKVFIDHDLPNGRLAYKDRIIDTSRIGQTALLTVEGEKDDIAAPGQTLAAHAMCSSLPADRHFHYLQPGTGHYGIFSGRNWRDQISPRVTGFIRTMGERAGVDYDEASKRIKLPVYHA